MNESDFNRLVDAQLLRIEEALDACEADIDYENASGILTLRFANGSQIVINRQTPVRQIWVAARSGGFHFNYVPDAGQWHRDSDGRELMATLSELVSAQAGESVNLG